MHKNGKHSASEAPNDMFGQKTSIGHVDIQDAGGRKFANEEDGSLGGKTTTGLKMQGHPRGTVHQHGDRD